MRSPPRRPPPWRIPPSRPAPMQLPPSRPSRSPPSRSPPLRPPPWRLPPSRSPPARLLRPPPSRSRPSRPPPLRPPPSRPPPAPRSRPAPWRPPPSRSPPARLLGPPPSRSPPWRPPPLRPPPSQLPPAPRSRPPPSRPPPSRSPPARLLSASALAVSAFAALRAPLRGLLLFAWLSCLRGRRGLRPRGFRLRGLLPRGLCLYGLRLRGPRCLRPCSFRLRCLRPRGRNPLITRSVNRRAGGEVAIRHAYGIDAVPSRIASAPRSRARLIPRPVNRHGSLRLGAEVAMRHAYRIGTGFSRNAPACLAGARPPLILRGGSAAPGARTRSPNSRCGARVGQPPFERASASAACASARVCFANAVDSGFIEGHAACSRGLTGLATCGYCGVNRAMMLCGSGTGGGRPHSCAQAAARR